MPVIVRMYVCVQVPTPIASSLRQSHHEALFGEEVVVSAAMAAVAGGPGKTSKNTSGEEEATFTAVAQHDATLADVVDLNDTDDFEVCLCSYVHPVLMSTYMYVHYIILYVRNTSLVLVSLCYSMYLSPPYSLKDAKRRVTEDLCSTTAANVEWAHLYGDVPDAVDSIPRERVTLTDDKSKCDLGRWGKLAKASLLGESKSGGSPYV